VRAVPLDHDRVQLPQQKYAQPSSSSAPKQRYVSSGGGSTSVARPFANVVKHVARPPTIVTSNVPPGHSPDTVAFE